jgi:hypothetical protein
VLGLMCVDFLLVFSIFIVCILLCFMMSVFWPSTHKIYQKLNQSNITVLHSFYLVAATHFDPYLGHHKAVFLNMSVVTELS